MVDSIFEGNTGVGYYVSGGSQINIEGNVIEGNGGPGVVVMGASGVTLTSNVSATNPTHDTCATRHVVFHSRLSLRLVRLHLTVAHESVDVLRRVFAQYFEANCGYGSRPYIYMRPALDNTTAPLIKLNYDIVLNGAPSFHDGDSDYEKWGPIDWQYGRAVRPLASC